RPQHVELRRGDVSEAGRMAEGGSTGDAGHRPRFLFHRSKRTAADAGPGTSGSPAGGVMAAAAAPSCPDIAVCARYRTWTGCEAPQRKARSARGVPGSWGGNRPEWAQSGRAAGPRRNLQNGRAADIRSLPVLFEKWWAWQGLNLRPLRCQHSALPLSYTPTARPCSERPCTAQPCPGRQSACAPPRRGGAISTRRPAVRSPPVRA
ncbi:MAG: hypothetical protein QOI38_1312, partial [Sphingomonadales bacterium]|nr:hypothetical protein [Sphingomonadales bacterium]